MEYPRLMDEANYYHSLRGLHTVAQSFPGKQTVLHSLTVAQPMIKKYVTSIMDMIIATLFFLIIIYLLVFFWNIF